jgi:hypothetical protein
VKSIASDPPEPFDPGPISDPVEDWSVIEAGIVQRARLLDRILDDLYGAQTLLKSGALPPALFFGNSGYLLPLQGGRVPGGTRLHCYAADLVRRADGSWRVRADWTQAPPGLGRALAGRPRAQPARTTASRSLTIDSTTDAVSALKALLGLDRAEGDGPPLCVVLSPGPSTEAFSEHALLARLLECPLVEGRDLTVFEGRVWLKALGGFRRVHAIVRQMDDVCCDPISLRSDSLQGVAGLVDCSRRGTVLIANALGSGCLESGAIMPFLPDLARRMLGEDLILHAHESATDLAAIRVFALATPDGYRILPGVTAVGRPFMDPRDDASRSDALPLPARVAEDLFWFGRYLERCVSSARLLRAAVQSGATRCDDLVDAFAHRPLAELARCIQLIESDEPLDRLAWMRASRDTGRAFGLMAQLQALDALAERMRERSPLVVPWEVNTLPCHSPPPEGASSSRLEGWLREVIAALSERFECAPDDSAFGVAARIVRLGRSIERMGFQSLALQVALRADARGRDEWLLQLYASADDPEPARWPPPMMGDPRHGRSIDPNHPARLHVLALQVRADVEWLFRNDVPHARSSALAALQALDCDNARPGASADEPVLMDAIGRLRTGVFDLSDLLHQWLFRPARAPRLNRTPAL